MSLTVVTALCHAQGARTQSVSVVCVWNLCYRTSRVDPYIRQGRRGASAEPQQPSRPSASHPHLTAKRPKALTPLRGKAKEECCMVRELFRQNLSRRSRT